MSLEWIPPGNIKAGWNVVSRSSLLTVPLLFGNAICHPRIFRDSNKSTESNTMVGVIATESYCRFNKNKKKRLPFIQYNENLRALHFVFKPSNRSSYARRTKEDYCVMRWTFAFPAIELIYVEITKPKGELSRAPLDMSQKNTALKQTAKFAW